MFIQANHVICQWLAHIRQSTGCQYITHWVHADVCGVLLRARFQRPWESPRHAHSERCCALPLVLCCLCVMGGRGGVLWGVIVGVSNCQ